MCTPVGVFLYICFRVKVRGRVFVCVFTSPISNVSGGSLEEKEENKMKKRLEEKNDYLGRLGKLLTVLLLNLFQPAVALQQEESRECEREICRQTDRDTKKGSREIESSVRKCTSSYPCSLSLSLTHTSVDLCLLAVCPYSVGLWLIGTTPAPTFMHASR